MRAQIALSSLVLAFVVLGCEPNEPAPKPSGSRWTEVERLVKAKDYPAAYAALEAQVVAGKTDPDLVVRLAEVRRLQGEPIKAILVLREALNADPASKSLYAPLASLYLQVAQPAQAREVLEKARTAGYRTPELALLYGEMLGRSGELEPALRAFDEALELGAKRETVLYNRALVLGQLKRHDEAIQALEDVVKSEPKWAASRRELARAILDSLPKERAPVERALDILVAVKDEMPEDWRLHESIGDAWLLLGDYDAAVAAYTDALRHGKNPKQVEDRYRVAVTKQRERDSAAVPPPAK